MADPATTAPQAPSATPAPAAGAATATPAPAPGAPTPASVDAAIQSALDRAAKADSVAYRHEQSAKAADARAAQLEARLKAIDSDPFAWLTKEKGITPDMALERFAGGKPGPSEEVLGLRTELADLKAWRAQLTQAQAEQQKQAQIGGIAGQARQFVQAAQKPEVMKALAFADAVSGGHADFSGKVAAYQAQAEASGVTLTPEQAAGMIEVELLGMYNSLRGNQALITALDAMLGRAPSAGQPPSPGGQPAAPGQTLTSELAQGGTGGAPPDLSKMTEAQQDAYFRKKFNLG
jgi:hypothetical protein